MFVLFVCHIYFAKGSTGTDLCVSYVSSSSSQATDADYLNINLRVDAFSVKNTLNVHWVCETGFVENITRVISEYKKTRQLLVSLLVVSL